MSEKKAIRKRVSNIHDYRKVFSTPEGKRVLHDLMQRCSMLASTFLGGPEELAWREGQRNVVLMILKKMNETPEKMVERLREIELQREEDNR